MSQHQICPKMNYRRRRRGSRCKEEMSRQYLFLLVSKNIMVIRVVQPIWTSYVFAIDFLWIANQLLRSYIFFHLSFLSNNLSYLGLNFAYIILFFTVQYLMNTLEHKTTPPFMDMSSNKRFLLFPPSFYIQRMCTTYQLY